MDDDADLRVTGEWQIGVVYLAIMLGLPTAFYFAQGFHHDARTIFPFVLYGVAVAWWRP